LASVPSSRKSIPSSSNMPSPSKVCGCSSKVCNCSSNVCCCSSKDCGCSSSLIQSGKKNLFLKNIPDAVSDLSEACEQLSNKFGDEADECAEAFLYYGKALLELSKMENAIITNALDGVDIGGGDLKDCPQVESPEELSTVEKEDVAEKVAEALEENYDQFEQIAKIHSLEENEDSDMDESDEEDMDTEESPDAKTGGEETDNLQLAWEVVEVARVGFQKMGQKMSSGEKKKRAEAMYCEAVMVLGEISIENENFKQAEEDFKQCLQTRKKILPADSRCIAETFYDLGIVQGLLRNFSDAETSLINAISVLESRIANVVEMEPSESLLLEVVDLEDLVQVILKQIDDHKMSAGKIQPRQVENVGGQQIYGSA